MEWTPEEYKRQLMHPKAVAQFRNDIMPYYDDNGFLVIGILDFLQDPDSLNR